MTTTGSEPRIDFEKHAAGFYRAMGAEQIGEVPSGSLAGRSLPLLLVNLPAGA